jgi:sterol desaturase/sphingolipid hydroxylase (fatty acid hydroxylase superfamily)
MPSLEFILSSLIAPLAALLHPRFPLSLYYLLGTGLFLAAAVAVWHWRRGRRSLRGLRGVAFPKRLYLSASSKLDFRFYFVAGAFGALVYASMILSSSAVSEIGLRLLGGVFGPAATGGAPHGAITAFLTVALIVALDLGYWFGHWLQHNNSVLWEFHKVHHSAEVLTPFTTWRQHPVEDLLMSNVIAIPMGLTHACFLHAFGPGAQPFALWEVNIVLLLFYVTFFHLRHTHVWMPISGWLGRIVQSPAHHQIHHSTDPAHANKNLGFALAVWDWAFGTLYLPKQRPPGFGIGEESKRYDSCWRLMALPFANLWQRWRPRSGARDEKPAI